MYAFGTADAAEIRAEGCVAEADEAPGQRVGDLVGVGAAAAGGCGWAISAMPFGASGFP